MNEISLDFYSNLRLPRLCDEWESPSGETHDSIQDSTNAQSNDIRSLSETQMTSPHVIIQSNLDIATPKQHDHAPALCDEFRHSSISCKADIFFDDVINDAYSITRDILLNLSRNTSLQIPLPSKNYDSGLGVLVHSCALNLREESYALNIPHPLPNYFDISMSDEHRNSDHQKAHRLTINFDLMRGFHEELDKIQSLGKIGTATAEDHTILHSNHTPRLDFMDKALIERNIAAYDVALQILLTCLGFMMILFFDLYLHLQKQSSDGEIKGTTPLVAVLICAFSFMKHTVSVYFTNGYESLLVWKAVVIRSCVMIRSCIAFNLISIKDSCIKLPKMGLQILHAIRSRCSVTCSILTQPWKQVKYFCFWNVLEGISRGIELIQDKCSRASNQAELSVNTSFFIPYSNLYKDFSVKKELCSCLHRVKDAICLKIWTMFISMKVTARSCWYWLNCNIYSLLAKEWEVKTVWAMQFERNMNLVSQDALLLSPKCNYETNPGLASTGCHGSETLSLFDIQHNSFSPMSSEYDYNLFDPQLSFYEDKNHDNMNMYFFKEMKESIENIFDSSGENVDINESKIVVSEEVELCDPIESSSTHDEPKDFVDYRLTYDGDIKDSTICKVLFESAKNVANEEKHLSQQDYTQLHKPIDNDRDKLARIPIFIDHDDIREVQNSFVDELTDHSAKANNRNSVSGPKVVSNNLRNLSFNKPYSTFHGINEELLEKLKCRYISADDEADKMNPKLHPTTDPILIMGDRLSVMSHSQGTESTNVSSLIDTHQPIAGQLVTPQTPSAIQKDQEYFSSRPTTSSRFKTKYFTELMVRWGNTDSPALETTRTQHRRVLPPPRKIESPFLSREDKGTKVKKITPVKCSKVPAEETPIMERYTGEDPLSFLNNLLE